MARNRPTLLNGKYSEITSWLTPGGTQLCVYHKKAKNPKAVIHINHGLSEHAGRYARFAEALAKSGFEVYAQDHRGHGATMAKDAPQGIFAKDNGWAKVLADMKYVNSQIRQNHTELPIILFGHSMGAMLAYNYLLRWPESINAAAIWNADLSKSPALALMGFILAIESRIKGKNAASILSKFTFEAFNKKFKPTRTDCDWLSKDYDECLAYDADPDCGWRPSVSMWQDLRSGILYAASDGKTDKGIDRADKKMPIHILGGDADPSTRYGKAQSELASRLGRKGFDNIKLVIRANGRHEALNEPKEEREKIISGFIEWAEKSIASSNQ